MATPGRDYRRLNREIAQYVSRQIGESLAQVNKSLAKRQDPERALAKRKAMLARKRDWASRWLTLWLLVTVIAGVLAVAGFAGVIAGQAVEVSLSGLCVAIIGGTFAVRSGQRLRSVKRQQAELEAAAPGAAVATPVRRGLPPKNSAAREPIRRLGDMEATLADLLRQLTGKVPDDSIEHSRRTGAEAAAVLRSVAVQLQAVERARDHAPPAERKPLVDGVRRLRTQLDEGCDGYGSLVAAAGRAVANAHTGLDKQVLTDATDHLAGLAEALRELAPE